jgi:hypothetical protein
MKKIKNFMVKWFSKDLGGLMDYEITSAINESEALEKVKKHNSITFDVDNDEWFINETFKQVTF